MIVTPVRGGADLRDFIAYPLGRHPTERYVPHAQDSIRRWHRGTGPHVEHGPVELVLVRDDAGQVVGRSTVHSDTRMDTRLGEPTMLLGLTEFDGLTALCAISGYAERRAREQGCTALLGPVSLLPNQVGGVITSGFTERGFVDSAWNPPAYPEQWQQAGFTPIWPSSTWICEGLGDLDPDTVFGGAARPGGAARTNEAARTLEAPSLRPGVTLHRGSRRHLREQLPLLRSMLNQSFAELPYYTPITAAELDVQTDGLQWVLDESLFLWVEQDGVPVAFVLTVPDLSRFLISTGGRLAVPDQLRLLATRHRHRDEAVLVVKGTVPGARGEGLMSLLSHRLLVNLQAGGYRSLRVTFVGEDNTASAAQFEAMGGRRLHGVAFYRRGLEDA
ncbi:MAG: hypothetical protein H0U62_09755 [Actinobacteria bacterium]|nr:hypothetical protein [Actinomycetota bacterium]